MRVRSDDSTAAGTSEPGDGPPARPDDEADRDAHLSSDRHLDSPPPPASEPSDGQLVRDLQTPGEVRQRAWSELVNRHAHRMYAVARSFGVDQSTAEDLVQLAWLRLLERGGQLRDPDAVGPWLCMIVRNEARRLVTRRREVPTDIAIDRPRLASQHDEGEAADAGLLRREQALAVRVAFSRLASDCQQLLRLVLADPPLSYDQIAVAVGRPRGSLGPTRRRCLEQLRSHLPAGFES